MVMGRVLGYFLPPFGARSIFMMALYVRRTGKATTGRGRIPEAPGAPGTRSANAEAAFSPAYHRLLTLLEVFQVLLRAQLTTMLFENFCSFLLYIFNSHIKPFLPIFFERETQFV